MTSEDEATAIATADLDEAFQFKAQSGSDVDVAECLRKKGYVTVDDFRRAID